MTDQEIATSCLSLDQHLILLFTQALANQKLSPHSIAKLWFTVRNPELKFILRLHSPGLLVQLSTDELIELWFQVPNSELRQLISLALKTKISPDTTFKLAIIFDNSQ